MLKIVYFFQEGNTGWSETYYWKGTNPGDYTAGLRSSTTGDQTARQFFQGRKNILNSNCAIKHIRASLAGALRQTDAFEPSGVDAIGAYSPGDPTEVPVCLLLDWLANPVGGAIYHRRTFLGGIPESIVIPPQLYNDTTAWNDAFKNWVAVNLTPNGFLLDRPPVATAVPIVNFLPTADGRFAEIDVGATSGYVANHRARYIVRGVNSPRGWNGTHSGVVVAASRGGGNLSVGIGPTRRTHVTVPPYNALEAGTIQEFPLVDANFHQVNDVRAERITVHKRGRPFAQPVGRRSPP